MPRLSTSGYDGKSSKHDSPSSLTSPKKTLPPLCTPKSSGMSAASKALIVCSEALSIQTRSAMRFWGVRALDNR